MRTRAGGRYGIDESGPGGARLGVGLLAPAEDLERVPVDHGGGPPSAGRFRSRRRANHGRLRRLGPVSFWFPVCAHLPAGSTQTTHASPTQRTDRPADVGATNSNGGPCARMRRADPLV